MEVPARVMLGVGEGDLKMSAWRSAQPFVASEHTPRH